MVHSIPACITILLLSVLIFQTGCIRGRSLLSRTDVQTDSDGYEYSTVPSIDILPQQVTEWGGKIVATPWQPGGAVDSS